MSLQSRSPDKLLAVQMESRAETDGTTSSQEGYSVEEIVSNSWDRRLADELIAELEAYTGERRSVREMRKFLALKAYRGLLDRLHSARRGKTSHQALRSVAYAMREFAIERPVLAAAALRTPATDCREWNEAHARLDDFMLNLLAECRIHGKAANTALCTLKSLVRGFVLHEVLNSFLTAFSYADVYDGAIDIFIAGTSALPGDSDADVR